ncbi:hypothetical protein C0995_007640 [Termitomyces sp. Mi166|nr:hypothetical protein C0995_007640 [Termitomyces sp. Mi166\
MSFPSPAPVVPHSERGLIPLGSCLSHPLDCVHDIANGPTEKEHQGGENPHHENTPDPGPGPDPPKPSSTPVEQPLSTTVPKITPLSPSPSPSSKLRSVVTSPSPPTPQTSSTGDSGTGTTTFLHATGTTSGQASGSQNPDILSSSFSSSDSALSSLTIVIPSGANSQQRPSAMITIQGVSMSMFNPSNSYSEATSTSTSPAVASGASHKVNAGAIAGGILGALIFLVLLFYAIVLVRRRRRRGPPSAEFLNWSFQRGSPTFVENPTAYPFGSAYATGSRSNHSSTSYTTTIGHGFKFPPQNP